MTSQCFLLTTQSSGGMIVGQPIRRNNIDLPLIFPQNRSKYHGNHKFKESSFRQLYFRLTDPMQPVSLVRGQYIADNGPYAHFFKDHNQRHGDSPRCTCYIKMNRDRDVSSFTPQPQRFRNDGHIDPLRLFKQDHINKRLQLPLSTLVVRWQQRKRVDGYILSDLMSVFSQFGTIQRLRMLSPNSAQVVFDELVSACRVMQYSYLGDVCNKLHCTWWHKCMGNKYLHLSKRGVRIVTDHFVKAP
uniref:Uncharacterized protein LOC111121820 n=1 Tax=Crassostrea virginica TaxID=6565 RepID=A0A8B8CUQ4_CRAVI|nr:uncharacterized protein LOC111121820 [Crassostrea virginica]